MKCGGGERGAGNGGAYGKGEKLSGNSQVDCSRIVGTCRDGIVAIVEGECIDVVVEYMATKVQPEGPVN